MSYRGVLAAYATGVALDGFLPAHLGTLVMMLMFVAIIPEASFAGVVGAAVVQKIFFTVAGGVRLRVSVLVGPARSSAGCAPCTTARSSSPWSSPVALS